MHKDYFVYISDQDVYLLAMREDNIPPNKIAARVSLTQDKIDHLVRTSWVEYQLLLEHYFEHNQKLVTA